MKGKGRKGVKKGRKKGCAGRKEGRKGVQEEGKEEGRKEVARWRCSVMEILGLLKWQCQ
jgi:hypothetical protein